MVRHLKGMDIKNWWWVALFVVSAATLYSHAIATKKEMIKTLDQEILYLSNKKGDLTQINEELNLKLLSQDDPSFVELVLMKELGIVPEGYLKIHFENQ